jgi:hypothetical protein
MAIVPAGFGGEKRSQFGAENDLGKVIEAWPHLAEPMRVAVLAIVRAAGVGGES